MRGLGVETAKNIILCGVQSVLIQDCHPITYADLSSQVRQRHLVPVLDAFYLFWNQFYCTEADLGKNRAHVAHTYLAQLNPDVQVSCSCEPLTESFIQANPADVRRSC